MDERREIPVRKSYVRPLVCWYCGKNGLSLTSYYHALVCGPCFIILRLDEFTRGRAS